MACAQYKQERVNVCESVDAKKSGSMCVCERVDSDLKRKLQARHTQYKQEKQTCVRHVNNRKTPVAAAGGMAHHLRSVKAERLSSRFMAAYKHAQAPPGHKRPIIKTATDMYEDLTCASCALSTLCMCEFVKQNKRVHDLTCAYVGVEADLRKGS